MIAPIPPNAASATISVGSRGGAPFIVATTSASPPGASLSFSGAFPDTPMAFDISEAVTYQDPTNRMVYRGRVHDALPPSAAFDPSVIAPVEVTALDTSDPKHPILSWQTGSGTTGDVVDVLVHPNAFAANYWFRMPPDRTSFRLPDVPPELDAWDPGNAQGWISAYAAQIDQEGHDGWAGLDMFVDPPLTLADVVVSRGDWP